MYKFKQLEWLPHIEFNGVYAEPSGLKYSYSIRVLEDKQIRLSVLDSDYDHAPEFATPQFYTTVVEAQQEATRHYENFLKQFIIS